MSFDPETDGAVSPNRATVKSAYERLRRRGEDERAEALRDARNLDKQLQLAGGVSEFDPEVDPANSSSRAAVRRVYRALRERGEDGLADELQAVETVREQYERSETLAVEYDLEVRI